MIRVALRFYPNQTNPARPTGKGVYRVVECFPSEEKGITVNPFSGLMYMPADRAYLRRSRVDPLKLALRAAA